MNKRNLFILSMLVILIGGLFSQNNALGCWIKMYPKDLVEKSDVILIGEVSGPIGLEKRKSSPPANLWVQGIIGLSLNQTVNERNKLLKGEDVLKQYTINEQSNSEEEIEQIRNFITQAPIAIPSVDAPLKYSVDKNYSTLDKVIIVVVSLLIVLIGTVLVAVYSQEAKRLG